MAKKSKKSGDKKAAKAVGKRAENTKLSRQEYEAELERLRAALPDSVLGELGDG